jgi:hypothetical protein
VIRPSRKAILLEIVFQEARHQWDDAVLAALQTRGLQLTGPGRKTAHVMIGMTAGEAVRRVAAEHVPYAKEIGSWNNATHAKRQRPIEVIDF